MTDQQINRALALAIGWPSGCVLVGSNFIHICTAIATLRQTATWRTFDYRDPVVIWTIAERYDAFPQKLLSGWWEAVDRDGYSHRADTAAKAVALAVIWRGK